MLTLLWCLILLIVLVLVFCCLPECGLDNLMNKLYGFIDIDKISDKDILKKELDFINNSINAFPGLTLTLIGLIITLFVSFKKEIESLIGLKDISYVVFLFIIVLLSYTVPYCIEMRIKSAHKTKIIEKLHTLEVKLEKTTGDS